MVSRYAVIQDGIVVNVVKAIQAMGSDWVRSDTAEIGDQWDGSTFSTPAAQPEVPRAVTPLQMRKALRQSGLAAAVGAYLTTTSDEVNEEWEYALEIQRDNALIAAAATALNKTDSEVDALFILAATL